MTFETNYDCLTKFITDNANTNAGQSNNLPKQVTWLSTLKSRKMQRAACYTWQHKTFGIHSTQRIEAIHSSIRLLCSKSSTILDITRDIEQMAEEHDFKSKMQTLDAMLRWQIGQCAVLLPACEELMLKLAPFPRMMMNAQSAQLVRYGCAPIENSDNHLPDSENYYLVTLNMRKSGGITDATGQVQSQGANIQNCSMSDYDAFSRAVDHGITTVAEGVHGISTEDAKLSGRITTLTHCSCQYPKCWGLPCRHIFQVMMHLNLWESCSVCKFVFYGMTRLC